MSVSNMQSLMALAGDNAKLLEELYEKFEQNPEELDHEWRSLFENLTNFEGNGQSLTSSPVMVSGENAYFQELGVATILDSYRKHGHLAAKIDPLNFHSPNRRIIDSRLAKLQSSDMEKLVPDPLYPTHKIPLKNLIEHMEATYCESIGAEHYYLMDDEERHWLQDRMEGGANTASLSSDQQKRIFETVFRSDFLEKFLAKKYVGKKRFSLEGGESLNVLMDTIVEEAGVYNVQGVSVGMAHRGRLNVLVNIMQKPVSQLFAEFEERADDTEGFYSDVKYHLGYSNTVVTSSGKRVMLSLAFNPSHLEAVNPIVMGSVRAKQKRFGKSSADSFIPVLIHGDAAFPGQGVVAESLNLMKLRGFTVGGTIHIVVNNQIGFTTNPEDSRSTLYSTDMAKGFQIPVFHVNADDPEAVFRVMKLAFEYRMRFQNDVIIDLVCFRRHGHNEMDEPTFTQPMMYEVIRKHSATWQYYEKRLLDAKALSQKDLSAIKNRVKESLNQSFEESHARDLHMEMETMAGVWSDYDQKKIDEIPDTRVARTDLEEIAVAVTTVPGKVNASNKLTKLLAHRKSMVFEDTKINWGFAETLAFGSLLQESINIRLTGQDALRGTFSQRHLGVTDIKNNEVWLPLNHISDKQGFLEVVNSALSEFSVLGYEYGYSLSDPATLVMWEAQFGDFVNGAQVIIDQFIASSEKKWYRMSGLVLLLPHGYEGQGPEHSSARLERFLQLCAEENMIVANLTTPAQYFHILRKQVHQKFRKPLIMMTPKSLLRHPMAGSTVEDLTERGFSPVLDCEAVANKNNVKRLLFCTGKVYYDLLQYRQENKIEDTAIIRVEQLHPFPEKYVSEIVSGYKNVSVLVWVQEEPENQGAYYFMKNNLDKFLQDFNNQKLYYAGRALSASPATGLAKIHQQEQESLVQQAFAMESEK